MFLGFVELEATMVRHIQTKNSSGTPTAPDSAPTYRIYGDSGTAIATGTLSGPVDSQTGLYSLSKAITAANGFGRGLYSVRIAYAISSAARAELYTFQVV
jgi:hypothetical protein